MGVRRVALFTGVLAACLLCSNVAAGNAERAIPARPQIVPPPEAVQAGARLETQNPARPVTLAASGASDRWYIYRPAFVLSHASTFGPRGATNTSVLPPVRIRVHEALECIPR